MSKIHLHIEQLSLPGYTPAERRAFIAALERELAGRSTPSSTSSELQSGKHEVIRISSPDLRPQSVARGTIASLTPGMGKERSK